MPDAFLFDIGNVILPFDFRITARKLAPLCDHPAEEILQRVAPLMVELEIGRMGSDAFLEAAAAAVGYRGDRQFLHDALVDIFDPNVAMAEFIEGLAAEGTRLCLLSNTNGIHAAFFEARYPVFDLFGGRIYSHEVGMMKPDPAIFAHARDFLDLVPDRTIYVDDSLPNCEAGAAAGFRAIHYARERHGDFLAAVAALRG